MKVASGLGNCWRCWCTGGLLTSRKLWTTLSIVFMRLSHNNGPSSVGGLLGQLQEIFHAHNHAQFLLGINEVLNLERPQLELNMYIFGLYCKDFKCFLLDWVL